MGNSAIFFRCLRCSAISRLPAHATRCEHVRCGGKVVPLAGPVGDEDETVPWSRAWCEQAAMAHLIIRE